MRIRPQPGTVALLMIGLVSIGSVCLYPYADVLFGDSEKADPSRC
jgi:hypothetical protein